MKNPGRPRDKRVAARLLQGLDALRHGQADRAGKLFGYVVRKQPDYADGWHLKAVAEIRSGRPDVALRDVKKAVALNDGVAEYFNTLGSVLKRVEDMDGAEAAYLRATTLKPGLTDAHYNLGRTYAALERWDDAVVSLQRAVDTGGATAPMVNELGIALLNRGQTGQAIENFERALKLAPDYARARYNLAAALLSEGRLAEAGENVTEAARQRPDHAPTHDLAGTVSRLAGNLDDAAARFRRALEIDDDYIAARVHLAGVIQAAGNYAAARSAYKDILRSEPANAEAVAGFAELCEWEGRYDEGMRLIDSLPVGAETDAAVTVAAARLQRRMGRPEAGIEPVKRVLEKSGPDAATARQLHFTLGDLMDATGDYDAAFEHYTTGNGLVPVPFDIGAWSDRVDALIRVFDKRGYKGLPHVATEDRRPVFIVGMPRSGTSLTEQILAAHPDVVPAGELAALGELAERPAGDARTRYPDWLTSADSETIETCARAYSQALGIADAKSGSVVTDKMPLNYLHLGFIELIAPSARIVHCVRNPVDTCLSCHFQNFIDPTLRFSDDLSTLGYYYREYQRLMDHWFKVCSLPVFELRYEELVTEPETRVRDLLDFLGLTWDPACLDFHRSERIVKTASHAQVREPLHDRSLNRRDRYANHLEPLRRALAGD